MRRQSGLTGLDVSGLTNLGDLRCAINNITDLDTEGLTGLTEAWITGNPYECITFPDGDTLTLSANEGGFISTWNIDVINNAIELMPQADDGCFFSEWTSIPEDAEYTENGANTIWGLMGIWKITVDGDLAVSGTFSPIVEYPVIEGAGSVWSQGSQTGLTARADCEFAKFTGVMVDEVKIDPQYYTAASGSTVVSLKPEFLETLAAGEHTMSILFDDGLATVDFQVKQAAQEGGVGQNPGGFPSDGDQNNNENTAAVKTPKTGDSSRVFFTVLLALCAGVSAAVVLSLKTKENKIR